MSTTAATTAGNPPETDSTKDPKEKIVKTPFIEVVPTEMKNADGKLMGIPSIGEDGFDRKLHKMPSRRDFANEHDFLRFKADLVELKAEEYVAAAARYRDQAATIEQFGDPETRKKVMRLQKLAAAQAELLAELESQGVEIPS